MSFLTQMRRVQARVNQELALTEAGENSRDAQQLRLVQKELSQMELALDPKVFLPVYPRMIVDGWDFSDPLGEALTDVWELYKGLSSARKEAQP